MDEKQETKDDTMQSELQDELAKDKDKQLVSDEEPHMIDNSRMENMDKKETMNEKETANEEKMIKRKKILKKIAIAIPSMIGVLFIGYIGMLLLYTHSLERFGEPFWFEDGRLYFGPSSCGDENMRLDCSFTADPYSWCSCEKRRFVNGLEIIDIKKPIIYLYPESPLDLNVKLGNPVALTSSYPKYVDGWNITAYPNGDLIDKYNNRKLYALYWEGERTTDDLDTTTGFVVKGEDSAEFLEEKLSILGLNYREAEEFIVYWLPKLEANNYNYIYFATEEEIEKEMSLEFSVQPDTIIRVRMIFEGLDEYREVTEQTLEPAPERNGFTVVEWGGTELKKD